jgi:hypothetical protein
MGISGMFGYDSEGLGELGEGLRFIRVKERYVQAQGQKRFWRHQRAGRDSLTHAAYSKWRMRQAQALALGFQNGGQ